MDGLDPAQAADFLAQTYSLALASGVKKVFWYNYRDAGPERDMAESNFGLVDFRGFPKPAYAAYATSATMLEFAEPVSFEQRGATSITTFSTEEFLVTAIWSSKETTFGLAELGDIGRIVDQYGADQPLTEAINVTPSVAYIVSDR